MSETRAERIRTLLALEIARVTEDLELRKAFLMGVWTRHRTRAPFVDTTFDRWKTLGLTDLTILESREVILVAEYFRELDDLRLYLGYTEDMPRTLEQNVTRALIQLRVKAARALEALGAEPLAAPFTSANASYFGITDEQQIESEDPASYWGGALGEE